MIILRKTGALYHTAYAGKLTNRGPASLEIKHMARRNIGSGCEDFGLHRACAHGNRSRVEDYLKQGATVQSPDVRGATPLHLMPPGLPDIRCSNFQNQYPSLGMEPAA